MPSLVFLAITTIVATVLLAPVPSRAQDYAPESGDAVVVYVNKFKAEDFDRAKQIMVRGFGKAMKSSGQTRHTYWIANPQTGEILGISFFRKGQSVERWHDNSGRQNVLDQLEELRSAPASKQHYELIGTHNTGG